MVRECAHIHRPVQKGPPRLEFRQPVAGPVRRNEPQTQFGAKRVQQAWFKPRARPAMEIEHYLPRRVAVLSIPDQTPITQPDLMIQVALRFVHIAAKLERSCAPRKVGQACFIGKTNLDPCPSASLDRKSVV